MENEPSSLGPTVALSLLLGLAFASASESFGGFVTGAAFGGLLAQIIYLRKRTRMLREELERMRAPAAPAAVDREQAAPARPAASPAAPPATASSERVDARTTQPLASTPSLASHPNSAALSPPSTFARACGALVSCLKGGNPLARAGLVILFFGAAFLAKYAADHSLFPIELRFMALALGAFALLFIGWRLRVTRAVYARLLQGGGVAGLYLTVFAATRLYDLLPLGLSFGLLVIVALAAAVLAVAQNALSLAVIGATGGFLAPILVSTGGGDHVALFSYYAVLNLGVFAVAWFRSWRVLNVLGFVFTFAITGLWRLTGYEPRELFSADSFLVLFFLMYVGVSILNAVRQPTNLKGYVSGSLVFGLPVAAFTLHATLVAHIEYALAWSAFVLSAFYLALGWILYATRKDAFRLLAEAFAALGVIFASLAIPLAFDTRTTAAMWAVEGAGLLWLGVRQQRKLARGFGTLLQAAAGLSYLVGLPVMHGERPIINSVYVGTFMIAAAGVFSGYWLYRNRDAQAFYERGASVAFTMWALAWWSFGGVNEIARFLGDYLLGAALAFAAATSMSMACLGGRLHWRFPRLVAMYLPAASMVVGLLHAVALHHPMAQWGGLGWLLLIAAHLALLRIADAEQVPGQSVLHAGLCWTLALLAAWEASWQINLRTAGVWGSLPWGLAPALLAAWLGRRELRPACPLGRRPDAYRVLGAAPLVVATAVWILFVNLTSRGDAGWLPYAPLLNPLDVSVSLCFVAAALWWTSLNESQQTTLWPADRGALVACAAALAFVWLNAALLRSLHHNWGAPITVYGMVRSNFVQSALSIFWGVLGFAAMTIAARRRWRLAWLAGAGLMAVVILKLFLVDLSGVGTIARIASFLSVGALLLVTGYLAPLPPRRDLQQVEA